MRAISTELKVRVEDTSSFDVESEKSMFEAWVSSKSPRENSRASSSSTGCK